MGNMSYCRFRNTNIDLMDCLDSLRDGDKLSKEEFDACKQMFERFLDFCYDEGIVEDYEIDEKLNEFFETIKVEK